MTRLARLTQTVLVGLLLPAAYAGEYTDQVKAQLATIKLIGLSEGWAESHGNKFDTLDSGRSDSFEFTLRKGNDYKVISVCDEDCSDLDITLYDENDREIAKDTSTDSTPVVSVSPRWTGSFTLKVTMYECSSNPCFYGISILAK